MSVPSRPPSRRYAHLLAIGLALAVPLPIAACGGDDGSDETQEAARAETSETTPTETAAQPPPESAGASEGQETSRSGEQALAEDAATGPLSCPDVVVTPNSDNGLFAVEAEGITCDDAGAALLAWGESGYPGEGPPGFACEEVSEGRLSCEQQASGGVVAFDTGG